MSKDANKSTRTDLHTVPFSQVAIKDDNNNRVDYGNLQELADSIIANGIKMPLRATKTRGKDEYIITDGHRRYAASKMAIEAGHIIRVPIIKEAVTFSEKDRLLVQIICNDGKPFTMYEQGLVYAKLRYLGSMPEEIAKEVGKSLTHITDCLMLADAPQSLKDKIEVGIVSATLMVQQLKRKSAEDIDQELTEQIESKGEGKKITKKDLKKTPRDIKLTVQSLLDLYSDLDAVDSVNPAMLEMLHSVTKFYSKEYTLDMLVQSLSDEGMEDTSYSGNVDSLLDLGGETIAVERIKIITDEAGI